MSDSRTSRGLGSGSVRRWLLLNALLLLVVGLLSITYPVEELTRRAGDLFFRLHTSQGTSPHVALVLIDDASLEEYGRWPWNRSRLAQIVRAASAAHPKALGLDILLSETEDVADDRDLAQAIRDAGNVVLLAKIGNSPQERLWVEPLPLFARNAAAVGHAQAILGPDSICRSVPASELSLQGPRWAFALEVARVTRGTSLEVDPRGLRLGDERIPTIGQASRTVRPGVEFESPRFLPIDFRGQVVPGESSPPFSVVSAKDLLHGAGGDSLRGKAVLVGFGSTEIGDRIPTPVSGKIPMPGVEVHANLVDAILSGRSLHPLNGWLSVLLLCGFSFVSTWMVLQWPVWRGLVALAALLVGGLGASYFAFALTHLLVGLGPFLCVAVLAGPLAQLQNLVLLDRRLTQSLYQLKNSFRATEGESLPTALREGTQLPAGDLQWKVDLLDRLQAELGALYAFDQTLLEAMQEGLAVFSGDGRMIFRNAQWQKFCETQGWSLLLNYPEFTAAVRQPAWNSLPSPGTWLDTEVHLGEGLWQFRATRLKPSVLRSANELIMVVVSNETPRLQRDRARAEALAFVTHELRTPLVSIQGFAEYLLRYSRERGRNEAAATIFQESGRLVAIINTYLDVLRLDAGARPMRNEVFNLEESLKQVARVILPIAEASEIRTHIEIPQGLPLLRGDRHLIEGALLNLVSNAIKYSDRGSEVKLSAKAETGGIVLEVWNPGPAIPTEDLERLFEPFYRRSEQEDTQHGWGIGLAFVKRIAEQHGGKVDARSESASGTSFHIYLPASRLVLSEVHR